VSPVFRASLVQIFALSTLASAPFQEWGIPLHLALATPRLRQEAFGMYVTCHCQKGRNEEDPPMSKKPPRKDAPKFNLYQVVTDRIIASLKAG
jgi:hypothetical protein